MKRSHILLFGANAFGTGLLAPVLSLVLLSHGATLENLSLCIGIFAVMVVVLELPSGIMADLIGRKRIFLLSACFMMANYVLLMFSSHFLMLAAACAMQGIGRAFSSGSIEALEIETYLREQEGRNLEKINSTMAVIDSVGLALGSITGGVLGFLDGSYSLLLILALAIQALILFLAACFVKEPARERSPLSPALQFKEQLRGLYHSLRNSLSVITIVLMSAAYGLLLCTVEVYWQPTLRTFLPEQLGWIFGVVTCLGYLGVTIGSKAAEAAMQSKKAVLTPQKSWRTYWILRFLLVLSVAALGFTHRVWLFLALFVLVYIVLGAGNLIENTVFHEAIINEQRASMMSVLSLSLRAGGLAASVLGSLIVSGLSLSYVWLLFPLFSALTIGGIMIFHYRAGTCCHAAEAGC